MSRPRILLLIAWALAATASASAQGLPQAAEPPAGAKLPFQLVAAQPPASAARSGAADRPLPLAPPRRPASGNPAHSSATSPARALSTVISSLAIVLGVFALVVWFARRTRPRTTSKLPGDVVETLGRAPLNRQQEMHLVRVGNKLLLLSVTPTSAETLTEITDPVEINRLANLCRHHPADDLSASLRDTLAQLCSR